MSRYLDFDDPCPKCGGELSSSSCCDLPDPDEPDAPGCNEFWYYCNRCGAFYMYGEVEELS